MDLFLAILGGIVGLASGIAGGFLFGRTLRRKAQWAFWFTNGLLMLLGLAITSLGLAFGQLWLAAFAVGLIAGGLTGLKYGLGRSVGLWEVHDHAQAEDLSG